MKKWLGSFAIALLCWPAPSEAVQVLSLVDRATFAVELGPARHRQHYALSSGHVVDAKTGLVAFLSTGLSWGSFVIPDLQAAFLIGAGRPYRAYTAGLVARPRDGRGWLFRAGLGIVERPREIFNIDGGDLHYETPERFGLSVQVGYQFAPNDQWQVGPVLTWMSTTPEDQLSRRDELLALSVAVRFR